jgi:hypothetical protein
MSRSDFILEQQQKQQQQQNLFQQRKATSLKTISAASKILYPINSQTNNIDQSWYQKHSSSSHNKVPTSDSGIVIDTDGTRLTSKSSIEEVRLMSIIIFYFTNSIKTCTRDRKNRSHICMF